MAVDPKHIISLQGKQFVLYTGLLDAAHRRGLMGISTEMVRLDVDQGAVMCIMHAVVKLRGKDGAMEVYEGYGDATPKNVGSAIVKHLIRMAETRAKARALRDATNVAITAFEELSDDDIKEMRAAKPKAKPARKSSPRSTSGAKQPLF